MANANERNFSDNRGPLCGLATSDIKYVICNFIDTTLFRGISPSTMLKSTVCSGLRLFSSTARGRFELPLNYKPNVRYTARLLFLDLTKVWWKSLSKGRLEELEAKLLAHLFPKDNEENSGVEVKNKKTVIDEEGNYINEISFEVVNDKNAPTKHVVFIHGYGASLGCFARNFSLINRFKGHKFNYNIHFLDNLSFGQSSNPKVPLINYWKPIPKIEHIKLHDTRPTNPKELYKKYYKLIDGYDFDKKLHEKQRKEILPLLQDIQSYYLDAINSWRRESGIDKIDHLVGHSFGGYWSASYALTHPQTVNNVILLSPVGVERHAYALTTPVPTETEDIQPSLDPLSHRFLSRYPILSANTIYKWYSVQPYLPRLLKWMGPWGVAKYYDMWYLKLFAINKVIQRLGGPKVFTNNNELRYGTNTECKLLIEYLYNSISNGTRSDTHVKYLLTPATTSRWPLYDKFASADKSTLEKFGLHFVYGQFDFMNSEAGDKLVKELNTTHGWDKTQYHTVAEGGHNLYIQNPFGVNDLLEKIILESESREQR